MCTLLVFPWIFSYKKKDCIFFCCFLPLVSSAAASVATNRKELHADSSNILPCSATLLLWPGQTSRVFFLKSAVPLENKIRPTRNRLWLISPPFSCFRTLGLPPSPAPPHGGVWEPPGDQLHRAAERAGSPPALPPRQIRHRKPDRSKSGGTSTCVAAVSESSCGPDVMYLLFAVSYFTESTVWFAGFSCLFLDYGSIYALGRWFHAECRVWFQIRENIQWLKGLFWSGD